MSLKVKKGDTVIVNTGKDRGKQGKIERLEPKENLAYVVGVNIAKRHLKPSRKNPHGGIINKIASINISNITIVCPHCGKPSRVGYKLASGKKLRICKKCQASLDA